MDGKVWIMSVTCSWIFCTVLGAPAAEAAAVGPLRHVRHKRCSCASFLDKECVYFCHLDIIWVNTPERLVSYGLGNAPRARRALTDSAPAGRGARCRCARDPDRTCEKFCLRLDTATESEQRHETNRTEEVNNDLALPPALQVTTRTRALLEKWAKARRRHRARAWRGESRAS